MNRFRGDGRGEGSINPGGGGGGSTWEVGREDFTVSYSFVYFYFFGFHEILKNNTKDHFEHMLHHSIASGYYITIVLQA